MLLVHNILNWSKHTHLRYHPPSSTLLALIGARAFAFNKYPHKPYIFWKLNVPDYCLILLKIKLLTRFRNEKLFVKVGVTVNLSPVQPKINGRSQLKTHSHSHSHVWLKNRVSDFCQVRFFCCYKQVKLRITNRYHYLWKK